ncbi:peptidoglycan-binding domain-containing protein [Actinoplanes derwentensis]|uniref:peptidoglycan-binding domain-containing protein n=1 Tax=Actinoplanes derwentensis TaxID=113562 RepID=UPI0012FDFF20|nr:peptidoglycan-binding domain-containing protein [Actinoplanes derwentensis]
MNKKYPNRKKTSDGTLGDQAHKSRVSEHNPDGDGTIDAWDMDCNLLGSSNDTGSAAEDAEVRKVIAEFLKQPQAQLVIYNKHIHNVDIDEPGEWRWYGDWSSGKNPHDHHAHLQSKQSREDITYKGNLDGVVNAQPKPATGELSRGDTGERVKALQRGLRKVFPLYSGDLEVDGQYGLRTEKAVAQFQKRSGLKVDGVVGGITRAALAKHGIKL